MTKAKRAHLCFGDTAVPSSFVYLNSFDACYKDEIKQLEDEEKARIENKKETAIIGACSSCSILGRFLCVKLVEEWARKAL